MFLKLLDIQLVTICNQLAYITSQVSALFALTKTVPIFKLKKSSLDGWLQLLHNGTSHSNIPSSEQNTWAACSAEFEQPSEEHFCRERFLPLKISQWFLQLPHLQLGLKLVPPLFFQPFWSSTVIIPLVIHIPVSFFVWAQIFSAQSFTQRTDSIFRLINE